MKSERVFNGMEVPLCNDCVFFIRGSANCGKFELLDATHTGYWPSGALGNRIDSARCGMEGKYFERRETKRSLLSFCAHFLMEINVERYVFFILVAFVLVLVFGGI